MMFKLFKRKANTTPVAQPEGNDYFRSYPLATIRITTIDEFKQFCEYGYGNRMVIDYALSNPEHWKIEEPKTNCFAIVNYVPNAGMGRYVRVVFRSWDPVSGCEIAEIMKKAQFNYNCVADFIVNYAPDMIYRLLTTSIQAKD